MRDAGGPVTARLNTLWSAVFVEELVRHGVETFVVAPGSRSTPLVAAIAANPRARGEVLTDERVAAFVALGHGRATGRPAALVTTSGTAAAHAYPAVLEADADGVPLLVLSADRPPELRGTGANQTLDQVHLFGGHVRWDADLPAPSPDVPLEAVLRWAATAAHRAVAGRGPVHVNLMYRKPLEPVDVTPNPGLWPRPDRPGKRLSVPRRGLGERDARDLVALLAGAERGLVVIGGLADGDERRAAREIVARLGWPTFADLASGLRLGAAPPVVPLFGALLAEPSFADEATPDVVLQLGGRLISAQLEGWLAGARPREHVRVAREPERLDPTGAVTWAVDADLTSLVALVPERPVDPRVARWRDRSAHLEAELDAAHPALTEPRVARLVSRSLPVGGALFAGNSMPIRELDRWAASDGAPVVVGANRGASGIDGLMATATGFARGLGRPTTLLLGDQSFAHDVGALAAVAALAPSLTIVVVNNGGGRIFERLPIARHRELLDRWFTAPQVWSIGAACAAYGVPHAAVSDEPALVVALAREIPGPRVVEVVVPGGGPARAETVPVGAR